MQIKNTVRGKNSDFGKKNRLGRSSRKYFTFGEEIFKMCAREREKDETQNMCTNMSNFPVNICKVSGIVRHDVLFGQILTYLIICLQIYRNTRNHVEHIFSPP